ncbi:U4/U6 small nuclear ribonucleoprotein PRP4-like protein [Capsella rubella]|uniref:U4/U6 small nuclear ribonucleoprotein PRP4-like protein n=1 Tax=Capsella rubella TaxID=81985 RepID=UPI000CD5A33A|nr:U4/U6 small nuclear ribonucleoprotein PRP4-like protein [Capsella rubella]
MYCLVKHEHNQQARDNKIKESKIFATLLKGMNGASCGLDSLARVRDLRTGRSILVFQGHIRPVLSVNFSPNGYHLASGGEDNQCRIWDLRMRKSLYSIPAHANLVSQVKYEPQEGYFLADIAADSSCIATVSHDRTIKLWTSSENGEDEDEGKETRERNNGRRSLVSLFIFVPGQNKLYSRFSD